jgi:hypothetical protein
MCTQGGRSRAPALGVAGDDTGYNWSRKGRIMHEQHPQDQNVRGTAAEHTNVGRVMAVGTVVLWLVTLLLLTGPGSVRGLF